jgi:hypothetical protein
MSEDRMVVVSLRFQEIVREVLSVAFSRDRNEPGILTRAAHPLKPQA